WRAIDLHGITLSARRRVRPQSGRPAHCPFRGLGVHSRYGLHTRAVTVYRDTLSEGFSHFVTSIAAPVASGWSVCRVGFAPTGKRRLFTAHAIHGPLGRAEEPVHRSDVDDCAGATGGDALARNVLRQKERPAQVDRHELV